MFKSFEEHQKHLEPIPTPELVQQCIDRVSPILTHKRQASTMRVPVDFERDDDAFVLERLREIKRRVTE